MCNCDYAEVCSCIKSGTTCSCHEGEGKPTYEAKVKHGGESITATKPTKTDPKHDSAPPCHCSGGCDCYKGGKVCDCTSMPKFRAEYISPDLQQE